MKKREQRSSKRGYALIIIGGVMLLGLLNLGFLIPFGIAAFLIHKGWSMINGNREVDPFSEAAPDAVSRFKDIDPLDEWEQKLNKA
ncbi:hypothetical protein [Ammoniphilus sp. 3BR4]|uniref:hypothetical protein n=1 Tax=Ammoniphilus sp. 3BR4 TaxID=3158265 RepID=UPI0034679BDB